MDELDVDKIEELANTEPKDKKEEIHRNLKIVLTVVGIIGFGIGIAVNYYQLKKLSK